MKDVILCSPSINFPAIKIPCNDHSCSGHYEKKEGKVLPRVIHDITGDVILVQHNYKCSNGTGCPEKQKIFTSAAILETSRCPDVVKVPFESVFSLTKNSGITGELRSLILNDTMSPKSFDDIQTGIKKLREERYLVRRLEYEVAKRYWCNQEQIEIVTLPKFSTMEDVNGYNVNPNVPTSDTICNIFKIYTKDNEQLMASVDYYD